MPLTLEIGHHWEKMQFDVTKISTYDTILELSWLEVYNPTIDYIKREMVFDGCICKRIDIRDTIEDPELEEVSMAAITEEYD